MRKKHTDLIRIGIWLIAAMLLFTLVPATAFAASLDADKEQTSLKKVRVGYLTYPGYQEGEGDAPKSGYGYEYLQQIAYYAGWEYE